jgi:hypothetical protein
MTHRRAHIEEALLHRVAPTHFKLPEHARSYRGVSLMDIAEIFLRARGLPVNSMSKMERAAAALGLGQYRSGGMHSSSDFPLLLADVANKVLRASYEAAPQTFAPISQIVNIPDFKPRKMLQAGPAPTLELVGEHGEFTHGTIAESKEQFSLKTYGRIFAITRQALINDDLGAFGDVPAKFGQSARNLESDKAWEEITNNPDLGDSISLFDDSDHHNLGTPGSAISVTSLGIARAAMRVQKDQDGETVLNLNPRYLIVPASLETEASKFVSALLNPSAAESVNPFAGLFTVIAEPRLDGNSTIAWYLATDAAQAPVLFHGVLDGQSGPTVDQELGFDVDGVKMKCRLDVAFKAADFRSIYKNEGESAS